jgi:hypothetical protein
MGIYCGEGRRVRGLEARQRESWVDLGRWVMRGGVNLDENWARDGADAGEGTCDAITGR